MMTTDVLLRDVTDEDLPIFFEQQLDADANFMAAFTSRDPADRDAFNSHWSKILKDATTINKTILLGKQVAGYIASFERCGNREVCYWIGKQYWGNGIATKALSELLRQIETRPVHARVAKDNLRSLRVLEKCGFRITGDDRGFSDARGTEVEEYLLELSSEEVPC